MTLWCNPKFETLQKTSQVKQYKKIISLEHHEMLLNQIMNIKNLSRNGSSITDVISYFGNAAVTIPLPITL